MHKEIPRIKKLRQANQLDHYMLFANRRLAGNAETEIRAYLPKECDIPESSNTNILQLYENVVDEFQLKIIAKRKDYQDFDSVMNYLVDLLFVRDPVLRKHKRLTRIMLFYMYWNCDIGSEEYASTN